MNRIKLADLPARPVDNVVGDGGPVNLDVRYRILSHLLPDALPRDTLLTRNVRVQNTGTSVISSRTANPVYLSYHWRTPAGTVVVFEGERTAFPIDLPQGRTITVPTIIRTPPGPGSYMLELMMIHEQVAWLSRDAVSVGVEIVPEPERTIPAHWVVSPPSESYTYESDHYQARDWLREEFGRRHRPGMRVLEIGGCCNPMARGLDADVYSIDIDVQTLQIGQLSIDGSGERLHFVCADAHALPFAGRSFDCVVLFSSLHHFADPLAVLRNIKYVLKNDGFLAIMCEPVGTYLNGHASREFIEELEQGINEQIFTREEYHHFFQRVGLYATWVAVDGGSFKAILQPRPPA
ncbi:class I SAM-dependent methyltransferase [Fimbriiglobus ruber]|uniref:Methyltransferase type 11 domain-containing protein n=1 Tax=Fimbriiglobus ruber TaxID=1908690 RepID=A0A225ECW4_9BACT|nr:class I SAM-dependent methyltransferase [Fimbriiglobus ruber]OWK46305.1 hypothetical protein FRUB_00004 [Fimbriiglobus ruber]